MELEKKESVMELTVRELNESKLLTIEDVDFLREHTTGFEKRFRTRSLFRSKAEMLGGVLNDNEHPTPDSKYWQAIGEQNVHLTELINLDFETKKLEADMDLLLGEIAELEEQLVNQVISEATAKVIHAKIRRKQVEYDQSKFNATQQKKVAQERMREIKTWEPIIQELEGQLKYGDEDFGLHHAERYYLRYKKRADRLDMIDPEARESVVNNFEGYKKVLEGKTVELERPKETSQLDYKSIEEVMEQDKIAAGYFNRKVRTIMVCAPHRNKEDKNATNFNSMQPPAGFSCLLESPYGFDVPDARNLAVEKAIKQGVDYIFFVDDDVIIPRNALVKLMKHNTDVVGGMYYRKYTPLETVGMHETENGEPCSIDNYKVGDIIHNTLVLPSGCTLIKVDAFKKMEGPWYKTITVNGRPTITEDTYICQRFKDLGIDVITDTSVQCVHVDKTNGIFYGHPDIVNMEKNEIRWKYRDYFAV